MTSSEIGPVLHHAREMRGLSVRNAATALRCHWDTIYRLERRPLTCRLASLLAYAGLLGLRLELAPERSVEWPRSELSAAWVVALGEQPAPAEEPAPSPLA